MTLKGLESNLLILKDLTAWLSMTYRPGTRGIPRASFDRATKRVLLPPNAMILKEIKCLTPCCGRDTLVIQTCIAMILTNKKRRAYTKQRRVEAQLSRKIDYFKKIALANERMEYWKRILMFPPGIMQNSTKKNRLKTPYLPNKIWKQVIGWQGKRATHSTMCKSNIQGVKQS